MVRDILYDPELECDNCGAIGAYDFMGDYLCENCIGFEIEEEGDSFFSDDDDIDLWDFAG